MAFHNSGRIVTNGLVLSLDAADRNSYVSGSTTWFDLSGNNNSGSLVNGPTFNSVNGGSIVFDGVNDYVNLITPSLNLDSTTIGVVYRYNMPTADYPLLFGNGTTVSNLTFYCSALGPAYLSQDRGKISAFFKAGNTATQVGGRIDLVSTMITTGSYYHMVITYQTSSQANMYINGTLNTSASTNSSSLNIPTGSLNLGGGNPVPGGANFFNGSIALFQIYNRALSAQEVKQNYDAMKSRFNLT